MTLLTAQQILAMEDLRYEDVPVPEWGGEVRIRELTGEERDRFEASMIGDLRAGQRAPKMRLENTRARLVALAAVDAAGKRLFSEKDVARLGKKSAAALDRLYDVAMRLAGLRSEDIEELAKN